MFAYLKTGIDGLDGILAGGIRYPDDSAAFACIAGGPGTGKTLLALEMITRAFLDGEDGSTTSTIPSSTRPKACAERSKATSIGFGVA